MEEGGGRGEERGRGGEERGIKKGFRIGAFLDNCFFGFELCLLCALFGYLALYLRKTALPL